MSDISPREFGELTQSVKGLNTTMERGFKGINLRLDKQNGRVDEIEDRVDRQESFRDKWLGATKVLSLLSVVGGLVWVIAKIF